MTLRKTVLITGANAGIGLATAKLLAAKNYDVITLCRDKSKGEQTVSELRRFNSTGQVENFTVDLSDLVAVRKVATDITNKYPVIDRLVNNAGYYPGSIEYIGDIEKTLQASHLGHMLLTQGLMPSLERSSEAQVINVSSALHAQGSFARLLKRTNGLTSGDAYADAKLANILFTVGLTKHLPSNVTTYSLHPGVVRTNFAKGTSGIFSIIINLLRPFFISPEQGAATSVYLADENIQRIKPFAGQYFAKKKPKEKTHQDVTERNALSLWDKSLEILRPYLN